MRRNQAGLIPKLRPLFCRVPKRGFSRTPWHTYAHPPVSVCGTVTLDLALEAFLGDNFEGIGSARGLPLLATLELNDFRIFQEITPLATNANSQKALLLHYHVTPLKI